MGQQEVFIFLKTHPKEWWTSKQIADEMSASVGSVTTTLNKLRKRKEVEYKMSKVKTNQFLYKFKT